MILLTVFLICVFIVLGVGVLAGISDIRTLSIPNSYSVYVMASFAFAYVVMLIGGHVSPFAALQWHLLSAGIMFGLTFAMFGLRVIGAGDSKFATACALWLSARHLPAFIFYTTVVGAVLGLAALMVRRYKPFASAAQGSWVAEVQGGASKVPYAVAISIGMLIAFMQAGYLSPDVLSGFVVSAGGK